MNEPAVIVEAVSKFFRIPLDHQWTLQYRLTHPIATSRYRILRAVNDVSFSAGRGEFIGIAGPNGCGKSTLLKMLARIIRPDRGRIVVRGGVSPFLELGVGFNPELTARQNIFLGGAVLGLTRRQLTKRVDRILDFAELHDFADQKLRNFSTGMSVRLAFAVAIQSEAKVLLMDEVLAVGDAEFQQKCFEVFAQYKEDNRTVVLVSHDLEAIERYCDRALLITEGHIRAEGDAGDVVSRYRRMLGSARNPLATAAAVGADAGTAQLRWGTGEVEIVGVDVDGVADGTLAVLSTGDRLALTVQYVINRAVGDFVVSLVFGGPGGHHLGTASVRVFAGSEGDAREGYHGSVSYRIPTVRLLQGRYKVTAVIADGHQIHEYDHAEELLEFQVIDDQGRHGVVELGGQWAGKWLSDAATSRTASR